MIRFFGAHPTASNLLMLLLLAMGAFTLANLRRETFPDFRSSEVEIRIVYPGATVEKVEEAICQRVEDHIDGVRFVEEVISEAREGMGIITVEMEHGADFITFKDEINTAISAIDDFPPDAEEPIVNQLHMTDLVLALLVSGPMSAPDLKAYCEEIKRRLRALPEISLVDIQGFADHQLRVELSAQALMQHGLSVATVTDIIARQNIDLPAGIIETPERDLLVRFADERGTAKSLEDLVILAEPRGAELRVRDVGRVVDLFQQAEDQVTVAGQRAGILLIRKTTNQDIIRVATVVKDFVADERLRQPQAQLEITQDRSTLVADRLHMLTRNAVQGIALIFAVMWLFFNARLSFWVVMSLPVSFLGAFFFLPMIGLTINMLTMVGLLLALGLLMDDGIVIAENIATHRANGKPATQAAVDGIREVSGGVLSSFITTVCVLGPLAALEGDIGKVLKVVPLILILVLAVSLVEAFLILPAHMAHALHGSGPQRRALFRQRFDAAIDWVRERVVGRLVDLTIAWRYLWLGCVCCVFLVSLGLVTGGVIPFQAFPDLDGDVVVARVLMPPGTPLAHTEATVNHVTSALEQVNEQFRPQQTDQQDLVKFVYAQYNHNDDAFEAGPHVATVFVDLLDAEARNGRLDDIVQAWRELVGDVPGALSVVYAEPSLGPAGRAIEIRLSGEDVLRLQTAAHELRGWLSEFVGVYNLAVDVRRGKEQLRIRLRDGAFGLGLDAASVARQLRGAYQGLTADEIQVGSEAYEIDVQLSAVDQNSMADLENFRCTLPDGSLVPISTVVEIERDAGFSRIARVDGRRTVTLRGDLDPQETNTVQVVAELQRDFIPDLTTRFPEIEVAYEGEIKNAQVTQSSMRRGILIGLLGVFLLLSFQFRSYVEPLIVMVAIPLALIGVVWGHLLLGMDLSMPSMLGFLSLAGIVVNDSILLVLFLKKHRNAGHGAVHSAAQASRQRFRAIAITSLTTIAGLMPLLAERSLQAQVLIPLAVSIVFGLLASTVLVLLVIPSLYVILDELGLSAKVPEDTMTG
jgi:multidrug efflux pump subunit AcrB